MKRVILMGWLSRTAVSAATSASCFAALSRAAASTLAFAASFVAAGITRSSASASRTSDSFGSATTPRSTGWFLALS